ncbi:TetR/AcrR family transcriptional regulator [Nocardia sp. NPDC059240]|uniref:TetR/AcrR family transcriptional regulator n=1 Tax=Nocardia sp. NPDC059240 TaxID=3346786 RepID=UPI00367D9D77
MGRKRAFDYDEVIERATRLFWAKGYTNTSLSELLEVMGIRESSFYHSMKSKKQLYLECLRHYNDTVTRRRWEALAAEPAIGDGVRAYFRAVLDDLDDPAVPNVCLMAGSLSVEVLAVDELRDYILDEMRTLEAALSARLRDATVSGELPHGFPSDVAAQVIVTFLQGLFRVIRVLDERPQMERQIEALLTGLGL